MKWILPVIILWIGFTSTAQTVNLKLAQQKLVEIANSRDKCPPGYFGGPCQDSVLREFIAAFKKTLLLPGADTFGFSGLVPGIISTPDKQARFFFWDDGMGGTLRSIATVVQYKTTGGHTQVWSSPYGFSSAHYIYYIDSIAKLGNNEYLLFESVANGLVGGYVIGNCHISDAGFTIENAIFENNDKAFQAEVYLCPARDTDGNPLAHYSYNAEKKELLCSLNGATFRFVYDGSRFRRIK